MVVLMVEKMVARTVGKKVVDLAATMVALMAEKMDMISVAATVARMVVKMAAATADC